MPLSGGKFLICIGAGLSGLYSAGPLPTRICLRSLRARRSPGMLSVVVSPVALGTPGPTSLRDWGL
eukprot:7603457-Pyramimonas_sp.AAC.1